MITTVTRTPDTGLSDFVVAAHSAHTAPEWTEQGTGLSSAGTSAFAQVAALGARVTSLRGLPPRAAPV